MPKYNFGGSRRLIAAAFFGALVIGTPVADEFYSRDKIYPGVQVGSVELGGATLPRARKLLDQAFKEYAEKNTVFVFENQNVSVPVGNIIAFNAEATLTQAQGIGRDGDRFAQLLSRADIRFNGVRLSPIVTIDESVLTTVLRNGFSQQQRLPQKAHFVVSFPKEGPHIEIKEGTRGSVVNLEKLSRLLLDRIAEMSVAPIPVELTETEPPLYASDLEPLRWKAEQLLARASAQITIGQNHYPITPEILSLWISAERREDKVELTLNKNSIMEWLLPIAKETERAPIDAVFAISPDGKRVTQFNPGTPGFSLLWNEENFSRIAEGVLNGTPVTLLTEQTLPRLSSSPEAAQYGIKELVGSGTTSFKGSPPNRIKNIKRGAALLNGILIAPGEEFSVLDHLRPFTLENGYLPELVIKASEGRTTPEIGGGLCQIGTTMFRAVLHAGLPVTERRNHSYRVSYYEPPVGMDATIYDPAPDFKFINDTGNWLLLTTEVSGTNLTFDLWGTKDGRTAVSSTPEISNKKSPPEKKIIETLTLPPGKIKCTEKAHIGSDARFTYTVAYADGRVEEKEFFSRYRPWQEVCLLGVKELTPVPEEPETPPETIPPSPDTLPPTDTIGTIGTTGPETFPN